MLDMRGEIDNNEFDNLMDSIRHFVWVLEELDYDTLYSVIPFDQEAEGMKKVPLHSIQIICAFSFPPPSHHFPPVPCPRASLGAGARKQHHAN